MLQVFQQSLFTNARNVSFRSLHSYPALFSVLANYESELICLQVKTGSTYFLLKLSNVAFFSYFFFFTGYFPVAVAQKE